MGNMMSGDRTTTSKDFVSFKVDDVKSCLEVMEGLEIQDALKKRFPYDTIEAFGLTENLLVSVQKGHGLISTLGQAYDDHRPISLSPSHIWLLIAQGIGEHIDLHSQELKEFFTESKMKENLDVRCNEFTKGSPGNNWPSVFDEFVVKIDRKTNSDYSKLLTRPFSTTSPAEKASFAITLMSSMKDYFTFSCSTMCGFPMIYLEGTLEDWQDLHQRTLDLASLLFLETSEHIQTWIRRLQEITKEFEKAYQGQVNKTFWKSFFKIEDGSGGPFISGWINELFPYFHVQGEVKQNEYLGISYDDYSVVPRYIPNGVMEVPFTWYYFDKEFKMKLKTGFFGVEQILENKALRPTVGWLVIDTEQKTLDLQVKEFNDKRLAVIKPLMDRYRNGKFGDDLWDHIFNKSFAFTIEPFTEKDLVRPVDDEQRFQEWRETAEMMLAERT